MSSAGDPEGAPCPWCQEACSEPATTPCGHRFCRACICEAWDTEGPCTCPVCDRSYDTRPELRSSDVPCDVPCDVCPEPKLKALKSCLVCLSSFCDAHLQPHLTVPGMKRHQLMDPVGNLEDRMCPKHQRPLDLFCGTDQSCICYMCFILEHREHELLSLQDACERSRSSLLHTQDKIHNLVEQRRTMSDDFLHLLDLSDTAVNREKAAGRQVFSALVQCVQRQQEMFFEEVEEKQCRNYDLCYELEQEMEQEIHDLRRRSSKAEHLGRSHDPLHVLQRCPALTSPAGLQGWCEVYEPETCEGSLARALAELETTFSREIGRLPWRLELSRVQGFAVDVTLDPDTAHPQLLVSHDLKQVHCGDVKKQLPDSPHRFDSYVFVLGKQSFSSGSFYFEVQVEGKTKWELGVARESVRRKGLIHLSPKNGFWCMCLTSSDEYAACASPDVRLSPARAPQTVGVFVDHAQALVSFYDAHSADLLYSFTGCSFREKLFPIFSPCNNAEGSNSAPLVLTAV